MGSNKSFTKGVIPMAKKQRKVLNITNLQASETSVSNDLAFDKPRWLDLPSVGEDEAPEFSYLAVGSLNWGDNTEKVLALSTKAEQLHTLWLAIHSDTYPREIWTLVYQSTWWESSTLHHLLPNPQKSLKHLPTVRQLLLLPSTT